MKTSTKHIFLRVICFLMLLVMVSVVFAGCGAKKLNGTYRSDGIISQSFTFSGDNVTMSAFGINATGTYEIKGDKIYITYFLLGIENTWEQSFSRSGNTITIGGTVFTKV